MLYWLLRKTDWLSAQKRLELYPPFRAMRISVIELDSGWRSTRILLPLNARNRNPGGGMFGGAMASLADPIPALACARLFSGTSVWTRSMHIDFRHEGRSDLELRFSVSAETEAEIARALSETGRSTPEFEYGFYDRNGRLCAHVVNRVAIRPGGYRPSNGALGHRDAPYQSGNS